MEFLQCTTECEWFMPWGLLIREELCVGKCDNHKTAKEKVNG